MSNYVVPEELRDLFQHAADHYAPIPAHSPYQYGDVVRRHGYSGHRGNPNDHGAIGFTGWVASFIGATILIGITTTGRQFAEYWGALERPDVPIDLWGNCVCCRKERMRIRNSKPVQLELFALPAMSP